MLVLEEKSTREKKQYLTAGKVARRLDERFEATERVNVEVPCLRLDCVGAATHHLAGGDTVDSRILPHCFADEVVEHGSIASADLHRFILGHRRTLVIPRRIDSGREAIQRGVQHEAIVGELLQKPELA